MSVLVDLKEEFLSDYGTNLYMERYWKFIEYAISRDSIETGLVERHHILPRSLYPNYSKLCANVCELSGREHYIIHFLLAKATNHDKMWFAFNQMQRVIPSEKKGSSLYQYARKYVCYAVSRINSGRPMTPENKQKMSERVSGHVVVRDEDDNTFRVSVEDERYKEGELVFYRVGYKHPPETIEKMKKSNKLRGTSVYHNPNNKEERGWYFPEEVPDGWEKGESPLIKDKIRNKIMGMEWYHDPINKKNKRLYDWEEVPGNLVKGRYFEKNVGLELANGLISVVDLKNKKATKVKELEWFHAPQSGTSSKKTKIYVVDGKIFTSWARFDSYVKSVGIFLGGFNKNEPQSYIVPPPRNASGPFRKFKIENQGKNLYDLGIEVYNLSEFDLYQHKEKEIVWT